MILRSIEPNWEGNQTWFVIAGGVIFAAWPLVSGGVSGCTGALLVLFDCSPARGLQVPQQLESPAGGATGTWMFIGGFVPTPCSASRSVTCCSGSVHFDRDLRVFYAGTFMECSMGSRCLRHVSLALLTMHGPHTFSYALRGDSARAARAARLAALALIVTFGAAGVWVARASKGIVSIPANRTA